MSNMYPAPMVQLFHKTTVGGNKVKRIILRWSVYLLGLLFLALGIALSIKTALGISPISSVAFSISEIWHINLGVVNFVVYAVFVAAQFALRGKNSRVVDLLQLAVSFIFSWALDKLVNGMPYNAADHGFWGNFAVLLVAIVFIGVGVSGSVQMKLIPNPGDGIVQAVAEKMGWEQGFAKNVFDVGCVCVTVILGLLFSGELIGVGVGTVAAMLGVGRVVALTNRLLKKKVYTVLTS